MHDWMGGYGPMGWGMILFGSLFWIALFALILAAILRLLPSRGTFQSSAPREDEALAILRQRYARGEIEAAEFERMRRDLQR